MVDLRKEEMVVAGTFITVEGPDGAGKTSVLTQLLPQLKQHFNQPVILTREPGGAKISEKIRDVILNPEFTEMDARTEALLYAASRRQHLVEVILPALARDEVVVCDRFVDSSVAYQGGGRQIGEEAVLAMNQFATGGLNPDLTLYLDVPVEVGLARIRQHRQNQFDRLDQETVEFHQRVSAAYQRLLAANPERIIAIDATRELAEVTAECLAVLKAKLPALWQ